MVIKMKTFLMIFILFKYELFQKCKNIKYIDTFCALCKSKKKHTHAYKQTSILTKITLIKKKKNKNELILS